ncbi:zinc ribbon domain-containing protein [Ruminococcus callidus]|jgi:hypothetical protein|nr:zinc ribbon domain-containing protein [Ruminococcus callidus]
MLCPNCGTELDDNAKDCYLCGFCIDQDAVHSTDVKSNDSRLCWNCGNPIDMQTGICPVCGTKVQEPQQNLESEHTNADVVSSAKLDSPECHSNHIHNKKLILGITITAVIVVISILVSLIIVSSINHKVDDELSVETSTSTSASTTVVTAELTTTQVTTTETTSMTTTTAETTTTNLIDLNNYIGFWHSSDFGNARELTISNVSDKTLVFTLWYYRLSSIDDVSALIEGNIAKFDTGDVSGYLKFDESAITVVIERSSLAYMNAEQVKFDGKHNQSWENGSPDDTTTEADTFMPYEIQIKNPKLNIYDKPSYSGNIVGTITDQQYYTIVEEYMEPGHTSNLDVWGKLKSGMGWINLYDAELEEDSSYMDESANVYCPSCGYGWFTTGVGDDGFTCPSCGFKWNPYVYGF